MNQLKTRPHELPGAQMWIPGKFAATLLHRMAGGAAVGPVQPKGFRTALGSRLVALSWAFHQESLEDEVIESYLVELVAVCEKQCAIVEAVHDLDGPKLAILAFLDGIIELAETLDSVDFEQMRDDVLDLEGELAVAYISLQLEVAA